MNQVPKSASQFVRMNKRVVPELSELVQTRAGRLAKFVESKQGVSLKWGNGIRPAFGVYLLGKSIWSYEYRPDSLFPDIELRSPSKPGDERYNGAVLAFQSVLDGVGLGANMRERIRIDQLSDVEIDAIEVATAAATEALGTA